MIGANIHQTIGIYLPKERSDYLPFTPSISALPPLKTNNHSTTTTMKKELWQKIIHLLATILTAIATTLSTTSCINLMG